MSAAGYGAERAARRSSGTAAEAAASSVATGRSASRAGRDTAGSNSRSAPGSYDGVPAGLEAGGLPGESLAQPDELFTVERHLTGAETVETDGRRPHGRTRADRGAPRGGRRGAGAAATRASSMCEPVRHIDPRTSSSPASRPPSPPPSSGHDHVEPHHLTRHEQHRSPATAPPDDLDPGAGTRVEVDGRIGLARTEHERRPRDVVPPDRRADRIGNRPVMQRLGRPDRVLECEAVQRSAQDAIGRYGRHVSGMPLTDTITQAVARGARHGRASRIPASSGVRSRFVRLHGRHAAATFSHVCGPPFERGTT